MLPGLNAAAAGMTASQQRLDALSGDVANVSTPGYRPQRMGFRELMYNAAGVGAGDDVRVGAGSAVSWLGPAVTQGALLQTGRNLDVAIEGSGFLSVKRSDGSTAFTRAGALQVTADRRLVTRSGDELQPPVKLPAGVGPDDLVIAADGAITADGRPVGRLVLVEVPVPTALQPLGDGLLAPTRAAGAARPAADQRVLAGTLEQSGVDLGEAMVDVVAAQRAFSLSSRAMQTQDELMRIANQVKR